MKTTIEDLIKAERRRIGCDYIINTLRSGRRKPKKFKHSLQFSLNLFDDLIDKKVISPDDFYIEGSAFFEFDNEAGLITISFISLFQCEDLHRKIDFYIIKKVTGSYPLKRFGTFF